MKNTNKDVQKVLLELGKTFKVLTQRERKILRLRYGLEDGERKTLEQLAGLENVTRERIRQIEARAFEKINLIIKYEKE